MIVKKSFVPACMPGISLNYLVTLPDDRLPSERLPMIVFLHGAGERGADLDPVASTGLAKLFVKNQSHASHRVITLCPQCPSGLIWNNFVFGLKELVDSVADEYAVDRTRISITGLSMGGYGTWDMITAFPRFFSAAAPICGGGITWRAGLIAHLPIRAFHSERDPIVISANSKLMVDAVNACGGNAELTLYNSADHNCWDRVYQTTDLISWLISHKIDE